MHISIPVTEELPDTAGGRYVLYTVYLEAFMLFKVRYRDLHFWDEQMHRIFGDRLPVFPPKHYLAMTASMAEERRLMLECYLQQVFLDPVVSSSEIFMDFLTKCQMETVKMPTVKLTLKVYLPDGRKVEVDCVSSDTAERVLEVSLYKLGLSRELKEYFSLFITHKDGKGVFHVVKRIAHFELPFITIWNINDDDFQIELRKWYMSPSTDVMLMGCTAAVDLLYCQAVQELDMNWSRPTEAQRRTLQEYIKTENRVKFLELMQQVEHYGCMKMGPCAACTPEGSRTVTIFVGNSEINLISEAGSLCLPINLIISWHVNMNVTGKSTRQPLEFTMEYQQQHSKTRMTIRTEQAFLLSNCLQKILSEQPATSVKEDLEILENSTSSNILSRKLKQVSVPKEKVSFSPFLGQSDVFESQDFDL